MKKLLFIAVCLLAVLSLTAQKKSSSVLYLNQSQVFFDFAITLSDTGVFVQNDYEDREYEIGFRYDRFYPINPAFGINPCDRKFLPFKKGKKPNIMWIIYPNGQIEKTKLYYEIVPKPLGCTKTTGESSP